MTIAVDLGRKATKQTNKLMNDLFQRDNQVFKPNILFVLLHVHCGVGKD